MNYLSVKETSIKWDISERRVQKLCEDGRIKGVERFGRSWMIPKDSTKPDDMRKREAKYIQNKK
ncbi:MAG: helix-turn-helix domain-containing protein [Oscillospiraceae bacterium]